MADSNQDIIACENQDQSGRDPKTGKWLPGVSGNPTGAGAGRPPGPDLIAEFRKAFETDPNLSRDFVMDCIGLARGGNGVYAREILDRLHGKVSQAVDLTGHLRVNVQDEDPDA